jgi:predicted component of type VI protein secretion system
MMAGGNPPAKTGAERVAALRAARHALGLKRLELYAHPEDWPAIKALAERLQRKRTKKLAPPRAG